MNKGDVVQFNENHKWCGCLAIISGVKDCGNNGIRYQVYVDVPMQGQAYIFVMDSENAIEYIGKAKLVLKSDDDE